MKYYYLSRSGIDMIFVEVGDAVISAMGYETIGKNKYSFEKAAFLFFPKRKKQKLGKYQEEQEIAPNIFWNFVDDPAWFKQKLIKTVFD